MVTEVVKINRDSMDAKLIQKAGRILQNGGLVAFPTETVYGLGANALDVDGAKKTYGVKGRPADNPLIVHIAHYDDLKEIAQNIAPVAEKLAKVFWPGPLTMIFEKRALVPLGTTGGLDTVAVRMPKDKIALALIEAGGGYVSAPSANISGRPSPTLAEHVLEDLDGKIEMIVDGGAVDMGVESTILDMTVQPPMILRPGFITAEMLEEVIGSVALNRERLEESDSKPKAPGMKYRHYAPKGSLSIIEGDLPMEVSAIQKLVKEKQKEGKRVAVIATDETVALYPDGIVKNLGSRKEVAGIAGNLYRILRELDQEEVEFIYSESIPQEGIGIAVMNRLEKAAGFKRISAETILL